MTDFERFSIKEIQAIVDAHFAGQSSFEKLINDHELCGFAHYVMDTKFCNRALNYLIELYDSVLKDPETIENFDKGHVISVIKKLHSQGKFGLADSKHIVEGAIQRRYDLKHGVAWITQDVGEDDVAV